MKANIQFWKNDYNEGWKMNTELEITQVYPLILQGNKKRIKVKMELPNVSLSDFFSLLPSFQRRINTRGDFIIGEKKIHDKYVRLDIYRFDIAGDFYVSGTTDDETCFTAYEYPWCKFELSFNEKELLTLVKKDLRKIKVRDLAYIRERVKSDLLQKFSQLFAEITRELPIELKSLARFDRSTPESLEAEKMVKRIQNGKCLKPRGGIKK